MGRKVVVVAVTLVAVTLSACGSSDPDNGYPAAPPLVASAGIGATAQQVAEADPCTFLDPAALRRVGRVDPIEQSINFNWCETYVGRSGPGGVSGEVTVRVEEDAYLGPSYRPSAVAGITVYTTPPEKFCNRTIVASDRVALRFSARSSLGAQAECALTDAAVAGAVPRLARGDLAPQPVEPNSLARQDACRLLLRSDIEDVPGIDPALRTAGARGQSCTWGVPAASDPSVLISFSRSEVDQFSSGPDSTPITVAGLPALLDPGSPTAPPSCTVEIDYRALDVPSTTASREIVAVEVDGTASVDELCTRATEIANSAAGRLPAR